MFPSIAISNSLFQYSHYLALLSSAYHRYVVLPSQKKHLKLTISCFLASSAYSSCCVSTILFSYRLVWAKSFLTLFYSQTSPSNALQSVLCTRLFLRLREKLNSSGGKTASTQTLTTIRYSACETQSLSIYPREWYSTHQYWKQFIFMYYVPCPDKNERSSYLMSCSSFLRLLSHVYWFHLPLLVLRKLLFRSRRFG